MEKISKCFALLAILLTNIMVAVVAFGYARMLCGIEHSCYSAPAEVAFLYAIPYGIAIAVCVFLAWHFHARAKK